MSLLMETSNKQGSGFSSPLNSHTQRLVLLFEEDWSDDEIFIPTLGSYPKGGSDVQGKGSDDYAQHDNKQKQVGDRTPHVNHSYNNNVQGDDRTRHSDHAQRDNSGEGSNDAKKVGYHLTKSNLWCVLKLIA